MSAKPKRSTAENAFSSGALLVIRFCLILAVAVGCYLLWVSLGGVAVAGCGPESNCDKVLHSRWAYWFGIPVSAAALLIYGATFAGTLRLGNKVSPGQQRQALKLLIPCAVTIIGAAIWFVILQVFVIKAICPFCMAAHGAGLVAAVMILFSTPFQNAPEKSWQMEKQVFIPPALAKKLSFAAVGGLALLAAGQTLHQRKTFAVVAVPTNKVERASAAQTNAPALLSKPQLTSPPPQAALKSSSVSLPPASVATNVPNAAVPPSIQPAPNTNGLFQIYGGLFSFDLRAVPVIGNERAPHTMVSLFDYTCHHCRIMHGHLMEAHKTFSNRLAIVSLPMPLDSACNPTVRRTPSAHSNACEYARIGLALWRANRKAHAQFDDWVFAGEHPPPLNQTRDYANQLAGKAAFDQAMQDRWVDEQIHQSIAIYSTNMLHLGNGAMPQLIIGNKLASGTLKGAEELYQLLAENLGLKSGP